MERQRISLGMKSSYIQDITDIQMSSDDESDEGSEGNSSDDEMKFAGFHHTSPFVIGDTIEGSTDLSLVESRASVPPLEVPLEEIENLDKENHVDPNEGHNNKVNGQDNAKSKKQAIKKAKEER